MRRLKLTILLQDLSEDFKKSPDLYVPLWIAITLFFSLFVFGNISLILEVEGGIRFGFLFSAISTIAFCSFLLPVLFWLFLVFTGLEKTTHSFLTVLALYNYGNLFYIAASILAIFPISALKWLSFILAYLAVCKFLYVNFQSYLKMIQADYINSTLGFVFATQLIVFLSYKMIFFA